MSIDAEMSLQRQLTAMAGQMQGATERIRVLESLVAEAADWTRIYEPGSTPLRICCATRLWERHHHNCRFGRALAQEIGL